MQVDQETLTPRQRASRENGAKSTGPNTEAGKARSSKNAIKHGFRSSGPFVIDDQDKEAFEFMRQEMLIGYLPASGAQKELVEKIVVNTWRVKKLQDFEADLWDSNLEHAERLHEAFTKSEATLTALHRLESSLSREMHRCIASLLKLQAHDQRYSSSYHEIQMDQYREQLLGESIDTPYQMHETNNAEDLEENIEGEDFEHNDLDEDEEADAPLREDYDRLLTMSVEELTQPKKAPEPTKQSGSAWKRAKNIAYEVI